MEDGRALVCDGDIAVDDGRGSNRGVASGRPVARAIVRALSGAGGATGSPVMPMPATTRRRSASSA